MDTPSGKPSTLAGHHFLELLGEDEMAFDNLFCVAFKMLDAQWLVKRASYMEFNVSAYLSNLFSRYPSQSTCLSFHHYQCKLFLTRVSS